MKFKSLILAAAVLTPAIASAAPVVFVGYQGTGTPLTNPGATSFVGATGAADARSAFLLGLSNVFKEDFQDSSWTNGLSLATARPLSFSDGVNTLAGTYTIQSSGGNTTNIQTGIPAANNWGDFQGLATNPASTNKWVAIFSPTVTISLNPGQSAIGFFLNDVRDQQARNVTVSWADGSVTSVLLGAASGLLGNQNLYFVGMKSDAMITSVTISGARSSDGIALDEVIVGSTLASGAIPIPVPPAAVGGLALLGGVTARRVLRK